MTGSEVEALGLFQVGLAEGGHWWSGMATRWTWLVIRVLR